MKSTLLRMDNVGVVVNDIDAAVSFFIELGMELEGQATVQGESVDRLVGMKDVVSDIAMMRMPDGSGRIELTKFRNPPSVAAVPNEPQNTLGKCRVMFAVTDLREVLGRLQAKGGVLVDEVAQYEDAYLLCYVRGPEGFVVALAQQLNA